MLSVTLLNVQQIRGANNLPNGKLSLTTTVIPKNHIYQENQKMLINESKFIKLETKPHVIETPLTFYTPNLLK